MTKRPDWDPPFLQPIGVHEGYWCSRHRQTGAEVRCTPGGRVEIHGEVPAEIMLAVLFAAEPRLVTSSRHRARAAYLRSAASALRQGWDEAAVIVGGVHGLPAADTVRTAWPGSLAAVEHRKLLELAERLEAGEIQG